MAMIATGCSTYNENHIAVCGGNEVKIIDLSKSEGRNVHQVWSWNIEDGAEGMPTEYSKYLMPLDECKFVDGKKKLLLTSSSSSAPT